MSKLFSFLLISLLTLTTFNLAYAQVSDTDDTEELECTTLSYSMRLGSRDERTNGEVSKLQVFLSQANYLDSDPTGYYGQATRKAVRSFQQDNRLVVTGTIGAVSRAKIKALSCNTSYTNPVSPATAVTNNPVTNNSTTKDPNNNVINVSSINASVISDYQIKFDLYGTGFKNTGLLDIGKCTSNISNESDTYTWIAYDKNYLSSTCGVKQGSMINVVIRPTGVATYKKSISVNIPLDNTANKIIIGSAKVEQLDGGQVNVTLKGSGFNNGASIKLNSCSSSGVSSLSSNSDTETGTGYAQEYFFTCVTPGTHANIVIEGNGVENSNTYLLYIPTTLKNTASVKAYNVLGNEMSSGPIYLDQAQGLDGNNYILGRIDLLKGSYKEVRVKFLCGTMLDRNNNTTSNFAVGGKIKFGESSNRFNYFSCPADLVSVTKNNSNIYQTEWFVADITKETESFSAEVTSSDSWGIINNAVGKNQPVGEIQFYGIKADGTSELIKSIPFLYSIKG